jgi:hypothetical protein
MMPTSTMVTATTVTRCTAGSYDQGFKNVWHSGEELTVSAVLSGSRVFSFSTLHPVERLY